MSSHSADVYTEAMVASCYQCVYVATEPRPIATYNYTVIVMYVAALKHNDKFNSGHACTIGFSIT